jgi:hypothetical protein
MNDLSNLIGPEKLKAKNLHNLCSAFFVGSALSLFGLMFSLDRNQVNIPADYQRAAASRSIIDITSKNSDYFPTDTKKSLDIASEKLKRDLEELQNSEQIKNYFQEQEIKNSTNNKKFIYFGIPIFGFAGLGYYFSKKDLACRKRLRELDTD